MKPKPAGASIPEIMAVLKAQGPMNSYELAQRFGCTAGSIGGKIRVAMRYGWCAGGAKVWHKEFRRYLMAWQWMADPPVDFEPPAIFQRKSTSALPPARMTPEERRRKAEIAQDHDRWFAGLQAERQVRQAGQMCA